MLHLRVPTQLLITKQPAGRPPTPSEDSGTLQVRLEGPVPIGNGNLPFRFHRYLETNAIKNAGM